MELISAPEILSGLATSVHQLRMSEQRNNAKIQAKHRIIWAVFKHEGILERRSVNEFQVFDSLEFKNFSICIWHQQSSTRLSPMKWVWWHHRESCYQSDEMSRSPDNPVIDTRDKKTMTCSQVRRKKRFNTQSYVLKAILMQSQVP